MKKIIFLTCILFLEPNSVYAFNWQKCDSKVVKKTGPFGFLSSTSSFLTSTGECAMIGTAEHDKKVFIAQNIDQLKVDSARGQGEYLSAYASLSGCTKTGELKLANKLQKNFAKVYGSELENTAKQAYEQIEQLISTDPELNVSCQLRS